jgi:hypothetical protein
LGLTVFGNPNQVQQAFKTTIAIADADGTHVGNDVVYIVDKFVQVRAVDWSSLSKDFAHLRSLNFPKPFRGRKVSHFVRQRQPSPDKIDPERHLGSY